MNRPSEIYNIQVKKKCDQRLKKRDHLELKNLTTIVINLNCIELLPPIMKSAILVFLFQTDQWRREKTLMHVDTNLVNTPVRQNARIANDLHQRASDRTSQTTPSNRSDRLDAKTRENLKPQAREGSHRSLKIQGCLEVGRPLKTPLNAVETSKEQQRGWKRLGFEKLSKRDCIDSIVVRKPSIGRSLYIYRPGRTYPF